MSKTAFNPVNFLVSLVVGWFVMSFLHAAARSMFAGSWAELLPRFKSIAFFQDGRAAAVNAALIIVLGIVGTGIWFAARQK